MSAHGIVRVAVVQAASVAFDRDRTLERVGDLTDEAARQGGRLIVFPEAFVSGYPRGLDFGARVGSRSAEGRDWFRRYWASAVDVPGPATEALAAFARRSNAYLVIGVVERCGGTLYCSVLFFDPAGNLLGKHRKLMPTAAERLVWGFGDGSTMPVLDTAIGRIGAAICWENYMPLLRMHLYSQGIELYCARPPTTARPGKRRCGTSPWRVVVSSSPATSSHSVPTIRTTTPRFRGATPLPSCRAEGAASSIPWAGFLPAHSSTDPAS